MLASPPVHDTGVDRRYMVLAAAVLVLAAINLAFRLGREVVTEWDESFYVISAWEMLRSGNWVATTFGGAIDYYNTKPPLNVWLIALSFKAFGVSLMAARLPSAIAAWFTVLTVQLWARRAIGRAAALFGSALLATGFSFLYTHAGRSANPDAPFTLTVVLTIAVTWASAVKPARLIWLGPVLAGAFLLKGLAVFLPASIAVACGVWMWKRDRWREYVAPMLVAALLAIVPVVTWGFARWRIDDWTFVGRMFSYDFVGSIVSPLENHSGGPWYYLAVLQRQQFDWIIVGVVALLWSVWSLARRSNSRGGGRGSARPGLSILFIWIGFTLGVPTLMQTKLPWYVNPAYPALAIGTGWIVAEAYARSRVPSRALIAGLMAIALLAAEVRLVAYSLQRRDLAQSTQGHLLAIAPHLTGHRLFSDHWENGDVFVLRALIDSEPVETPSLAAFFETSRSGDLFLSTATIAHPELSLAATAEGLRIYRREDSPPASFDKPKHADTNSHASVIPLDASNAPAAPTVAPRRRPVATSNRASGR